MSSNLFDAKALVEKYPDILAPRPPDPELNLTVQTVLATEKLQSQAFPRGTDCNQWLFDPSRSPEMHAIAAEAHGRVRELIARDGIEPGNSQILVHFVGSDEVHLVYPGATANRFAAALRRHDATQPYCDEYDCNIRLDRACAMGQGGSSTMLMPLLFNGVLLVFECCGGCHYKACGATTNNLKFGILTAQAQLPRGAHIDPGSPPAS
jgi:hypothetical protein